MAGLQLSGLASGFDWQSLVDKLMDVERVPQTRLRAEQTLGTQRSTALGTLNTRLLALKDSLASLSGGTSDTFAARTATMGSSTSTWSASAGAGTVSGAYSFNVTQLATKALRQGAGNAGAALSATPIVSGVTIGTMPTATAVTGGEFTVNGARITIATTDSLQDVFNRISAGTGGAVTASYDSVADKVLLNSTGEIVLGSGNDSSNFLSALQLYNNGTGAVLSSNALGTVNVGATIGNANLRTAVTGVDLSGNGSFTINGVSIGFNVNSDSVSAVLARINSSDAGVTASFDRVSDRFTLTNKNTGDVGIAVSEGAGGLLNALGLNGGATLVRGKNAEFTVDGGSRLISASNTLDAAAHGITGLSVQTDSVGAQTVTVAGDSTSTKAKIENFIAKYNEVQSFIDAQTKSSTSTDGKVTAATLAGNQEVSGIGSALRSRVFSSVPGLTGAIQRLESIGIDFKSGSSEIEIKDAAKLDAALRDNANEVRTLFSSSGTGLGARLTTYLTQVTGTTGTIATQTATISKNSKSIDDQIAAIERRITQQRELLTQNFIKMEEAQSRIQSQLQALTNAFGGSSAS